MTSSSHSNLNGLMDGCMIGHNDFPWLPFQWLYNVLELRFLHFLGQMLRSDWSETGSTSLLWLPTKVTILAISKNLRKKIRKFCNPSCVWHSSRKLSPTYSIVTASLAQLVAWLVPRLSGTRFGSRLGWPFIFISPHPRVCKLWPEWFSTHKQWASCEVK